MRKALVLIAALAACGDNLKGASPDAPPNHPDAPDVDAPPDIDAPPDAPEIPDGIAEARASVDGTGLTLAIHKVVVTYLKPQIGDTTNDPAGFTIQAKKDGPALFVSVDPATLTPVPAVGDVVSFTITTMGTVHAQRRAQALTDFTRDSTGADVSALAQDVNAATDLVTNVADYDSEIVNITGVATENFVSSGAGFQKSAIATGGITADPNLQIRAPLALVDSIDMVMGCTITAHNVPVAQFDTKTEIGAFVASDVTLTNCPAPQVTQAIALSSTSVKLTFSRNIKSSSVNADGSDFTFDNGLTASAAVVAGRTVTLTTTAQAVGTTYTVTIANTVTDLQGSPVTNGASFGGFVTPAVVKINEFNGNITGGCDLIELRVIQSGSMAGFKITERNGGTGELNFTFPDFTVQKNDFIVVHMSGTNATVCNPGNATSETTDKAGQPAATFPGNFDTAYDFWSNDNGLTNTDNVLTLFDATGAITDAVFVSNNPAGTSTAAATLTAANKVGVANQWMPAQTTYTATEFRTNAADDLDATGVAAIGTSIQRINDTDTDSKADWTTGAGTASTFGALNPGQNAL